MKTRIQIWAILPLLVLLSCTMETWEEDFVKTAPASGNVSFKAYLDDSAAATRTSLGEKDDNGFYPVYWSENDKIKIMTMDCEPGEGREFTLTEGAGTAQGVFNGNLNQAGEENQYIAVYPYSTKVSYEKEGGYISIALPQEQRYVMNSFDINANPAVAFTTDDELHFKNVCGLLRLELTGDVTVKRIKLRVINTSEVLWGTCIVRSPEYSELSYSMGAMGAREKELDPYALYLNCEQAVQLTETPTVFYFVVPADALNPGFQLELYDEDGQVVGFRKTLEANSVGRSKIREMPSIDFRKSDYVTGANPDAVNLSENGTANSYMVHPDVEQYPDGRLYTFYALRKGNGAYPITGGREARVLFRTFNGLKQVPSDAVIKDVSFDETTGFISFRNTVRTVIETENCYDEQGNQLFDENGEPLTQEVKRYVPDQGNATIALLDEDHQPLWSWHIWVTDYDPEMTNETYPNGTGAVMMTRNLGAVSYSGLGAVGFFYEWGRKDPLIRSCEVGGFNSEYPNTIYKTYPSSVFDTQTVRNEMSPSDVIEQGIQHPTSFIDRDGQWWVQPTESPWERTKTLNDPCPPGWRVPDPETFFFSDLFDRYKGLFNHVEGTSGVDRRIESTDHSHSFLFPDMYGYGTCAMLNIEGSYSLMEGGNYFTYYTKEPRMIRCQKEETGHVDDYTDLSENGTANCYVVNKPGRYKFRADVKGNSEESVGGVSHVSISWQSSSAYNDWPMNESPISWRKSINSDEYGAGVYYKDGYVYFITQFQWIQGSAVISVADASDRILWSWHIWFTDYDPYSSDACITIPGSDGKPARSLMKYNLGAAQNPYGISSASERGMMYQWGRKDPFIGAMYSNSDLPGFGGEYENYVTSETRGTVDYTIRNPWIILKGKESEDLRDWNYAHDNTLWGDEKTIYDPCPAGYKVPPKGTGFLTVGTSSFGFFYEGNFVPAGGYRYYASSDLENVGSVASYWSSSAASDGSAYDFYWNGGDQFNVSTHTAYKAQVNHVRCMRE